VEQLKEVFNLYWKKYWVRRTEVGALYSDQMESIATKFLREYRAKFLLILIYVLAMIYHWNPSEGHWSLEIMLLVVPTIVTFVILICNALVLLIFLVTIFFKLDTCLITGAARRFDSAILNPLTAELSSYCVSFILTNFAAVLAIFDRNWKNIINAWQSSIFSWKINLFSDSFSILFYSIGLPFGFIGVCVFFSWFIEVLKNYKP